LSYAFGKGAGASVGIWKIFFAVAALSNLAVGALLLFASDAVAARLGVAGPAAGYAVGLSGLMIAIFGVSYALAALDPARNRPLPAIARS
jgi:hypothetical protein